MIKPKMEYLNVTSTGSELPAKKAVALRMDGAEYIICTPSMLKENISYFLNKKYTVLCLVDNDVFDSCVIVKDFETMNYILNNPDSRGKQWFYHPKIQL